MRIGLALPNLGSLAEPSLISVASQIADEGGVSDVWVGDHIAYPTTVQFPHSDYPGFTLPGDRPILEPIATLAFLAAATTRVRIGTSVLIVPYRNPILVARMLGTIDNLSAGRLTVGVGSGWFAEEFETLDSADFRNRGSVTDDYLVLIRQLLSGIRRRSLRTTCRGKSPDHDTHHPRSNACRCGSEATVELRYVEQLTR